MEANPMVGNERKAVDVIVRGDLLVILVPQKPNGWALQIMQGDGVPNQSVMLDPGDVERLRQALAEHMVERSVPTCTKLIDGKPCGAPAVESQVDCNDMYSGLCEGHLRLEGFGVTRYVPEHIRVGRDGTPL